MLVSVNQVAIHPFKSRLPTSNNCDIDRILYLVLFHYQIHSMPAEKIKFTTANEYIQSFPKDEQEVLEKIQATLKKAVPAGEEVISYNMPAFKQHGILVYFAGYDKHIGFYPTGSPVQVFKDELAAYKTSKGAIQFPLDKSIPKALVKKIVRYRIAEDTEKANAKKKKS